MTTAQGSPPGVLKPPYVFDYKDASRRIHKAFVVDLDNAAQREVDAVTLATQFPDCSMHESSAHQNWENLRN